jgi:hypothetical protein
MFKHDKMAAKDMIINHYKGLEPGNEHKEARLAFTKTTWRDGKEPNDEHMQYLDFNYHRGDTRVSDKIGQTITLSRVRPPPEVHVQYYPGPATIDIVYSLDVFRQYSTKGTQIRFGKGYCRKIQGSPL